jgi:F-type H+-transporting ATPase subunit c
MTKKLLLLIVLLLLASPMVFAQAAGAPPAASSDWGKYLGAGIGMAIASGLCGLGQGRAVAGAAEGIARNPGAADRIQFALILGLVLIESLALYTFAIVFIKIPS